MPRISSSSCQNPLFSPAYVNRLDNVAGGGCGVVEEIVRVLELHKSGCKCLAASFKNTDTLTLNFIDLHGLAQ